MPRMKINRDITFVNIPSSAIRYHKMNNIVAHVRSFRRRRRCWRTFSSGQVESRDGWCQWDVLFNFTRFVSRSNFRCCFANSEICFYFSRFQWCMECRLGVKWSLESFQEFFASTLEIPLNFSVSQKSRQPVSPRHEKTTLASYGTENTKEM